MSQTKDLEKNIALEVGELEQVELDETDLDDDDFDENLFLNNDEQDDEDDLLDDALLDDEQDKEDDEEVEEQDEEVEEQDDEEQDKEEVDDGEDEEDDDGEDEEDDDGEDDDESYYSDSDDESVKKIENFLNKDDLLLYHPETKQINFNEMLVLCKIIKDVNGNPIDPLHRTIPILTKYEKSKVLGLRSKQINSGAEPFISVNDSIIDGYTIALMELEEKKIPFIVRRPLPNGTSEYWDVADLELI